LGRLATVIDCYTKACIGYAMVEHMRADLVIDALEMASRNYPLAAGAIFHSGLGTQYTSQAFANKRLTRLRLGPSSSVAELVG
jgi:putative transposase